MLKSTNDDVRSRLRRSIPVRLSRYDLLLWLIPLAFLLALVAATVFSMPKRASLTAASMVGALVLIEGLFRNPPTAGVPA